MAKAVVKPAPKVPLADEVEVFDDVEQLTPEWHALRRGCPTASRFASILAQGDGKMRARYLYQLAGELLSGETAETFRNEAMDRGREMEPEAREWYGRTRFADIAQVGFVRRTVRRPLGAEFVAGCSPDSLVGQDGVLEIKTARPDLLIEMSEKGAAGFPSAHRAQCQGTLWITGRAWCDLIVFYRGMPFTLAFRVERDEAYIRSLSDAVETFAWDLHKLVARKAGGR